jgi:hypothetical protein
MIVHNRLIYFCRKSETILLKQEPINNDRIKKQTYTDKMLKGKKKEKFIHPFFPLTAVKLKKKQIIIGFVFSLT